MRLLLLAACFLTQLLTGTAVAQDWPLMAPLRIGYPLAGTLGSRLQSSELLDRDLRRIGLIPSWHAFSDGLAAAQALHADEIDLAVDIAQHEVILARLEVLHLVPVTEPRAGDDDREVEEALSDYITVRHVLASEYIAERRTDALAAVSRELERTVRPRKPEQAAPNGGASATSAMAPATRQAEAR